MVVVAARIAAWLQRARSAGPDRRATAMPGFAGRGSVKRATRGPGPLTDPGPCCTQPGTGRSQSLPLTRASVNARPSSLLPQV